MNLIIYQNEAYLLEDRIKKDFKKEYKNLIITTSLHIENSLLIGINISIYDSELKRREERYIENKIFTRIVEYINYIKIVIFELVIKLRKK